MTHMMIGVMIAWFIGTAYPWWTALNASTVFKGLLANIATRQRMELHCCSIACKWIHFRIDGLTD